MSAFQVSPNHIGAIVRWYIESDSAGWHHGDSRERPEALMECLAVECYKSVRYRYPDGELPGPIGSEHGPVKCHANLARYRALDPVEVIKACDCLNYQSCEHPTWETSEAYKLLHRIRNAAIGRLPGYDAAEWEITDGAIKAVK